MSNPYSKEAQKSIDAAENKLGNAIKSLKGQIKDSDKSQNKDPEVEIIENTSEDIEVVIDAPEPEKKEARRSEFVKTDDPKILDRINDLYGQVKKSDAAKQMLIEHNKQIEARLIESIEKINKIERTTKDNASDRVEAELKASLRIAREEADFERIEQIEDKLLDLRVEKRVAEKIPAPQKEVTQKPNPQQQQYEQQLVHNAHYLEFLSNEKDSTGNTIRPYLQDWHPDNQKAVDLFTTIPKEFAAAGKQADIKTIMQVLDERIQGKKAKSSTSVLGSDGADIPAKNVVRLTQEEINVAKRMGIKPEAYARQKQLLTS